MIFLLGNFGGKKLPIDLKGLLKKEKIDCEIGFGDGRAIVSEGRIHPERGIVGIEYSPTSIKKAEKRVRDEGLKNILFIKSEASAAFDILFGEKEFEKIILRFPDPWPKKRHIKNRLLNREFFTLAANRLKDGGEINITTDDTGYRDYIIREIAEIPYLTPVSSGGYRLKNADGVLTRYEEKWRDMGKEIYEIKLGKVSHPPMIKHISLSLSTQLPLLKNPACISEKIIKDGETILRTDKLNLIKGRMEIRVYFVDWHLFQKTKLIFRKKGNEFFPVYNQDFLPAKSFELLKNLMETCQ